MKKQFDLRIENTLESEITFAHNFAFSIRLFSAMWPRHFPLPPHFLFMKRVTTPLKRPDAGSSAASACTYLPPLAMDRAYSEWGKS